MLWLRQEMAGRNEIKGFFNKLNNLEGVMMTSTKIGLHTEFLKNSTFLL